MIKTDFSQDTKPKDVVKPFFALPTILYGLNYGALGAMTNALVSLPFFGDFCLYFGQIFVLYCLVTRGLNTALIAAVITSTITAIYANDAYLLAILVLEMLCVHVAMRKGYFLFQSAMAYWLIVGIPLFLILHSLTSFASPEQLFIAAITLAFNALICVSVVAIFCWFLPSHFIYPKYYSRPPQLASLIFSLCMLTITLPAMVISLFFIWQSIMHNEEDIGHSLQSLAYEIVGASELEIGRHLDSLQTITTMIESNTNDNIDALLAATSRNYTLFDKIVITDSFGNITHVAPSNYFTRVNPPAAEQSKQALLYREALNATKPYISQVYTNLDDNSSMLNFVAPIDLFGQFAGFVYGSMRLELLSNLNDAKSLNRFEYVISDEKNRIIARSETSKLSILANLDYQRLQHPLITNIPTMTLGSDYYLYRQAKTSNNWTVTVYETPQALISIMVKYFFVLVVATSIVLIAFALIARSLSRKITKPLVDIAENFPNTKLHPQIIRESQVSSEMVKLTHKLIDSHEVMSNFHQQLSQQVNVKTKQLKQLNRELYSIAQKDSLTQLLNRAGFNRLANPSYRNCVRNRITMSLILVDIDHFKRINDTYGHPFGDKCIVSVAKAILKHCKRDTDIIGRYGGEEFILMIVGGEITEHNERIALIKNDVQNLSIIKNGNAVKMTISAGVCSIAENYDIQYEELLQRADNQLYISKREGRNKISSSLL